MDFSFDIMDSIFCIVEPLINSSPHCEHFWHGTFFYNNITVVICSHISCGTFDSITFAQEAFHNINSPFLFLNRTPICLKTGSMR